LSYRIGAEVLSLGSRRVTKFSGAFSSLLSLLGWFVLGWFLLWGRFLFACFLLGSFLLPGLLLAWVLLRAPIRTIESLILRRLFLKEWMGPERLGKF
jgi:hypothetical protein